MYDRDGNPIKKTNRGHDRYFVTDHDGVERETDSNGYISMERSCGFHPKPGCGPFATGGFTSGDRAGRIEHWFDGPAQVLDGDTGEVQPFGGCAEANDHARALNAQQPRRRYYAGPAKQA